MVSSKRDGYTSKAIAVDRRNARSFLSSGLNGRIMFVVVFLFLIFVDIDNSYAGKSSVVVIANNMVAEKSLTLGAVRSIFGMRLRSWADGKPVRVFVFNDHHPLHIEFSKKILGVFPHQLRWSWDRLVFSGTGQAPIYVKNEEQMLAYVENTPGAIGYITRSQGHGHAKELPVNND